MPVQMKDVAERCGVSITTVSHVINKTRFVAPATRERVEQAMAALSYYKNASARLLVRGRAECFGLIISDIENPFFPEVVKSFECAALQAGFDVLIATTGSDASQAQRAVRRMIEARVMGVAVMTSRIDAGLIGELTANLAPVALLQGGRTGPGRSNIRVDYTRGVGQAAALLRSLGHRKIGFISGPRERPSSASYRASMLAALRAAGLPEPRVVEGDSRLEGGAEGVRVLLDSPQPPTAILCGNDMAAVGALQALDRAGVRVPAEVSLIGCDDIPLARYVSPALTTIRIPRDSVGRCAFEALDRMRRSKRLRGVEFVLETELAARDSTGPPRGLAPASRLVS